MLNKKQSVVVHSPLIHHTRVLAIDPGYERLGVAILDRNTPQHTLLFSDCITTLKTEAHADRLASIEEALEKIIIKYRPTSLAIETLFFNTNQKTVMFVAEARGVILSTAARQKLEVFEYTPPQIKVAITSYGRSDKSQVISMIKRLITISKPIQYDDEYDAIAAGLTHFASVR